jgi:hypothetical protein
VNRLASIFAFAAMLLLGLAGGLFATSRALTSTKPIGAIQYGSWVAWPAAGAANPDPYSLAFFARRGDIPMTPVEGLAFFASRDSDNAPLEGRCSYELVGVFPPARTWTLFAYRPDGSLISSPLATNPAGRPGFTSAETVLDGSQMRIALSALPQTGNWLRLPVDGSFVLALRFYDTPLSAVASVLDSGRLPTLRRTGCAS